MAFCEIPPLLIRAWLLIIVHMDFLSEEIITPAITVLMVQ